MKKNILTIVILAISLINLIMNAVIIFSVVPTSSKTNQLVSKVASIIDLELEAPDADQVEIAVSDITNHQIPDKLTINLKNSENDNTPHFAIVNVSLSINKKHEDTVILQPLIAENENVIKEIVQEEFAKYTIDEVNENKNEIKECVLNRIQDHFHSDFIINVSFGSLLLS